MIVYGRQPGRGFLTNMLPELAVFGWRNHVSRSWSKVWTKSVSQMAAKVIRTRDAAAPGPVNGNVLPLAMPSDQKQLRLGELNSRHKLTHVCSPLNRL